MSLCRARQREAIATQNPNFQAAIVEFEVLVV